MTTPYQERPLPSMLVDAATEPFWSATKEGILRIKRCRTCAKVHWYPRALCPYCQGDTEWVHSSGQGEIYSVTVTRRAGPIPFALAYVRLAEGVTILTNIVDCDLDQVRIGDQVKVTFKRAEGGAMVPMFSPR